MALFILFIFVYTYSYSIFSLNTFETTEKVINIKTINKFLISYLIE